jgi:hypothetical protein
MYASNSVPTTLPTHELLGFKPDESVELQVTQIAQAWLTSFELASKTVDSVAFADLFAEDSEPRCGGRELEQRCADRQLTAFGERQASGATSSPSPTITGLSEEQTLPSVPR